jgi:hypothetical protein
MTDTLNQTQLAQIVSAVLAALNTSNSSTPKPAISSPVDTLAQKDRALVAGFKRKGIPLDQIKLMDRSNPKAEFNVKPFKLWMQEGRMVKKGEHGIRGLFHLSQTSELPKPSAKPVPAAQQQLFAEAKKVLAKKKGKLQPVA